jgi:hypothetical protein
MRIVAGDELKVEDIIKVRQSSDIDTAQKIGLPNTTKYIANTLCARPFSEIP